MAHVPHDDGQLLPPCGAGAAASLQAEALRKAGRYEEALVAFDAAGAPTAAHPWLASRRAATRLMLAAADQRRLTRHAMERPALDRRYGAILCAFEQVLASAPRDVWTQCQRIETLRCMKRVEDCVRACTALIEQAPDFSWAYQRRAWARRWQLHFEGALSDIDRSLQLAPEQDWSIGQRAIIMGMMLRTDDALAEFARLATSEAGAWTLERALVLLFADRAATAIPWLQRGLRRDDAYLGHYFLAVAAWATAGRVDAQVWNAACSAADATAHGESRLLGEHMRAGLIAMAGDRLGAACRLAPLMEQDDMLLELAVLDPATRCCLIHAPLAGAVRARLAANREAATYLTPRIPAQGLA